MIKVNISREGQITNSATFESEADADNWLAQEIAKGSFGKPEQQISQEDGSVITIPAEFSVERLDVTAEYAEKAAIEHALKCQQVGQRCIAQIKYLTDLKPLQAQDFDAIFGDVTLAKIERLLGLGSLGFAKAGLLALSPLPYLGVYTAEDVAAVVSIIDESGLV